MRNGSEDELTADAAQQTIARQAEEIAQLRQQLADQRYAQELREAIALAATAGTIATPYTHARLLNMIVETAAQVISARAAALFLIDEQTQELGFEVALGQKAEEVKKFRVPLGQGIAGFVAVSGQPIAVADVQSDPRHAVDLARTIGYQPQNILCVPLVYQDQIIGVLELLDKDGATPFDTNDMYLLGLFANLAAVVIEQSRTQTNLAALISEVLLAMGNGSDVEQSQRRQQAQDFVAPVEHDRTYQQSIALARLVRTIAAQGESELQACSTVLQAFADYLNGRSSLARDLGLMT